MFRGSSRRGAREWVGGFRLRSAAASLRLTPLKMTSCGVPAGVGRAVAGSRSLAPKAVARDDNPFISDRRTRVPSPAGCGNNIFAGLKLSSAAKAAADRAGLTARLEAAPLQNDSVRRAGPPFALTTSCLKAAPIPTLSKPRKGWGSHFNGWVARMVVRVGNGALPSPPSVPHRL